MPGTLRRLQGMSDKDTTTIHRPAKATQGLLSAPGWNQDTRAALATLLRAGAGRQLPVVFDFDNTIVRGDIGEATLAMLARNGRLNFMRRIMPDDDWKGA
jgi:hypothetical protein